MVKDTIVLCNRHRVLRHMLHYSKVNHNKEVYCMPEAKNKKSLLLGCVGLVAVVAVVIACMAGAHREGSYEE